MKTTKKAPKPKVEVLVLIDKKLLGKVARYASRHTMTISEVIERSLELAMQFVDP